MSKTRGVCHTFLKCLTDNMLQGKIPKKQEMTENVEKPTLGLIG